MLARQQRPVRAQVERPELRLSTGLLLRADWWRSWMGQWVTRRFVIIGAIITHRIEPALPALASIAACGDAAYVSAIITASHKLIPTR